MLLYIAHFPRPKGSHADGRLYIGLNPLQVVIDVLLRPTPDQSDEPSDLRGSLSPTTRHRCTHVLVYTAPYSITFEPVYHQ